MDKKRLNGISNYRLALLNGKKSVLFKTMVIYMALGSLLIALLSIILFASFSTNSVQEINKVSTGSLKQSMATFDRLWDALYLYMNKEFHSDAMVLEGMEMKQYSPFESSKIGAALNDIIDTNSAIDSVYLYNSTADEVFSNFGTATTCDGFYDKDIVSRIKSHSIVISKISDSAILYRKLKYSYASLNEAKNVITVVFSTDDLQTALIFNIDQNLLQNLIVPPDSDAAQNLLIIDKHGMVVSDSESTRIYSNILTEPYVQRILTSAEKTGYFIDTVNGKKSLVTFSHWDNWTTLGWVFVKIADYNSLLGDLRKLQIDILLITLFFILAGIAAAALFLGNMFRPFYRLIEQVRSRSPYEPKQMNEIEYLGSVYSNMVTDLDNLNSYKISSRPLLKQEFLNRLIHGDISRTEDAAKQAAALGIKLDAAKYRVISFRLDKAAQGASDDQALLKLTAFEIIAGQFEALGGEVAESGNDNISVILDGANGGQPIIEPIRNVQEACLRLLNLSFTAGIGTVEDGICAIRFSYRTAMESTAYRLVYGRGAVVDYTTEALTRQLNYSYPIQMEKDLIDAVKAADLEHFSAALVAFIDSIEKFMVDEMLLAIRQMSLMLIRTLKGQMEITHMQEAGIDADIREVEQAINGCDTMGDIRQWLLGYFERCMEAIRLRKNNRYKDVIDSIQKYINENYNDAGLTIDKIAEQVNLSLNYMRTLFKDQTGMTVSHYLNDIRFKKAAELLCTTSHPASHIAGMVGFPEGSYFYSAFKNSTGMTPEEYRKSNKVG